MSRSRTAMLAARFGASRRVEASGSGVIDASFWLLYSDPVDILVEAGPDGGGVGG